MPGAPSRRKIGCCRRRAKHEERADLNCTGSASAAPLVIYKSSIRRSSCRMTVLIPADEAFCIIATALHFSSVIVVMRRVRRVGKPMHRVEAGVSIIRPVCGVENFSEATLASAFRLAYPRYEILFCAPYQADPIVPLVAPLIQPHPKTPPRLP